MLPVREPIAIIHHGYAVGINPKGSDELFYLPTSFSDFFRNGIKSSLETSGNDVSPLIHVHRYSQISATAWSVGPGVLDAYLNEQDLEKLQLLELKPFLLDHQAPRHQGNRLHRPTAMDITGFVLAHVELSLQPVSQPLIDLLSKKDIWNPIDNDKETVSIDATPEQIESLHARLREAFLVSAKRLLDPMPDGFVPAGFLVVNQKSLRNDQSSPFAEAPPEYFKLSSDGTPRGSVTAFDADRPAPEDYLPSLDQLIQYVPRLDSNLRAMRAGIRMSPLFPGFARSMYEHESDRRGIKAGSGETYEAAQALVREDAKLTLAMNRYLLDASRSLPSPNPGGI